MENQEKTRLISVDEVIKRARSAGVDFGKGDPRNRLRYYAKLGLLPPAKRKCFNGEKLPKGAYPKEVVDILIKIDRKLKEGKNIQVVARELQEEKQKTPTPKVLISPSSLPPEPSLPIYIKEKEELKEEKPPIYEKPEVEVKKQITPYPLPKKRISVVKVFSQTLKIFIFMLLLMGMGYVSFRSFGLEKIFSNFLAGISFPSSFVGKVEPQSLPEFQKLLFPSPEPYLTINVETDINAPLNLKSPDETSPLLSFFKGEYKGTLTVANLTEDRQYILPDLSGTICLDTGNCFPKEDKNKVTTSGGEINRLVKFTGLRTIGNASILDLYQEGLAMTIDKTGNIGIGTTTPQTKLDIVGSLRLKQNENYLSFNLDKEVASISAPTMEIKANNKTALFVDSEGKIGVGTTEPQHALEVNGKIQATGDICTKLGGGKCLSQLVQQLPIFIGGGATTGGITGSGNANYIPLWSGSSSLSNSVIYQDGSSIGIGTTSPDTTLDVNGTIKVTGFQLPTGAQEGYVLTADASGVGTWQPAPSGTLPTGTLDGQTLRWDGTSWVANSLLFNDGTSVGIGTTNPSEKLTVSGNSLIEGVLTISTSTTPQLVLQDDLGNYLNFSIDSSQVEMTSSKTLVLNSLTGEIDLGSDVTVFDASSSEIRGDTFISSATDSTVRKSGERVFRAAIPIFPYSIAAQTESTSYIQISKEFSSSESLSDVLPSQLAGTQREFAFLIKYADDIPTNSTSDWRVYRPNADTTFVSFSLSGQAMATLEKGNLVLSDFYQLPDNDWRLEIKVPAGHKIRIFAIYLLAYDKIQ